MTLRRGALIVFEGCDRVGKTTQVGLLLDSLISGGHQVQLYKFPNRTTPVGQLIDRFLKGDQKLDDHAVHLLFSANRWECVDDMLNKLRSGVTLLVDRYAYSGIAYTAAKPKFTFEWCRSADVGLPMPDAVFYLSSQSTDLRNGFGDEVYEKKSFQDKVRKNFDLLKEDYWTIINADRTIEEVHQDIRKQAQRLFDQQLSENVGKLWI